MLNWKETEVEELCNTMLCILSWPIRHGILVNISRTNGSHTSPFFVKSHCWCAWRLQQKIGDDIYLGKGRALVCLIAENDTVWKTLGATPVRCTKCAKGQQLSSPSGQCWADWPGLGKGSIVFSYIGFLSYFFLKWLAIFHIYHLNFFLAIFLRRLMSTGMSNSKWLFCVSIFIKQADRDWPKANHRTWRILPDMWAQVHSP